MRKWLVIIAAVMMLGLTTLDGRMYVIPANEAVTLAWGASQGATRYEYRLVMFDKTPETFFSEGETTGTQVVISRPRTAHFRAEVRACNDECSEWSKSTDPTRATVDGTPMGWWLWWKVPSLQP